ncbi:MAG TPA: polysaccharide deacetylase family protein [Bacteroidales bacterium]|nr:polysaccharide deacetylase family protein [Bacteroidales bacterium]
MKRQTLFTLISLLLTILATASTKDTPDIRIARFLDGKSAAISYTFDDGYVEHLRVVAPEMEKVGFRGTFWVNGTTHEGNANNQKDSSRLSWAQAKELHLRGHEVSNHGWSHKNLKRISNEEINIEIERNDSVIEANIGIRPTTYCYAYNAKDANIQAMASQGRVGTRTKQKGFGNKATRESMLDWAHEQIEQGEWGVAMMHGIHYGYDAFRDANVLWQHFADVHYLKDQIWVGTFKDVAAYITERDSIRLEIKQKRNKTIVTPSFDLDPNLFTMPLTLEIPRSERMTVEIKQDKNTLKPILLSDRILVNINPYGGPVTIR